MKNKSSRHKEENVFKFQPFAERISNIDVDVFHKVAHEYETESEEECFFYQAVQKWNMLNLTEGYNAFCKEVHPDQYITLPQLVLAKNQVVTVLLKHLKLKNALCLQPLLEITVAVAKDLRNDFYDYFEEFFTVLIDILNTKDTDQLEWTFTCLAYLFKFLWKSLIKNIHEVFNALLPLLSDSKPEYINSFAAESFAFVGRKVKDKKQFLKLLIKGVKINKDGVSGCGKLLFEIIRGVDGQFHNSADTFLPFFFDSLTDENVDQEILFEILEQVVTNIVYNIHPQNSTLFWTVILNQLETLILSNQTSKGEKSSTIIDLLLKLIGQSIELKKGKYVQNSSKIIELLVKIINANNDNETILMTVCKITILMLLSSNIKILQDNATTLIRKSLTIKCKSLFFYFIEHVSDHALFEPLILPFFLKHCVQSNLSDDCLHLLAKIVCKKAPYSRSGIGLENWKKYSLRIGSKEDNNQVVTDLTKMLNLDLEINNFDNYYCFVLCLPHMEIQNRSEILNHLKSNLRKFSEKISVGGNELENKKFLFALHYTLECLIHLNETDIIKEYFIAIPNDLLELTSDHTYVVTLNILSLLVSFLKNSEIISMETLTRLNFYLQSNFSSPYSEMRLLTAHIYLFFDQLEEFKLDHPENPDVPPEEWKIFTTCYIVESIEPHVHTYRDQLQKLEKFNLESCQMKMCVQTEFKTIPLRYLCGTLFMNFKLIWEPVMKIIESHAHGLDLPTFWSFFIGELKQSGEYVRNPKKTPEHLSTECAFMQNYFEEMQSITSKPDFINYRLNLWKTMALFPDLAECKTRDTSELFLEFISIEYNKTNNDLAMVWNIKEKNSIDETMAEEPPIPFNPKIDKNVKNTNGSANLKTLLIMLKIFAKVRSPLSLYKEVELSKLYFDLLQHKNTDVQKAALDCIMTYKHKYLTPYKESLYNLVDDKNFKREITTFNIGKDSNIVQAEHRENLIPIVMQIVFSKMSVKTGLRTGGKSAGQNRRNWIFRFLADCQETEILHFIKKVFRYYSLYLHDDPEQLIKNVVDKIDLENYFPPKRLQSSLNLLAVILEQCGGLMSNTVLTYLLNVTLVIGASIKGALDRRNDVHVGYLPVLKLLRNSNTKVVDRFFHNFERYPWSNKQINAIFCIFVWPYLDKLNVEGIHNPTALLKLISNWGLNPRYFSLLVKHKDDNRELYILPRIISLLLNEKSSLSVINCVEEIIEKLLSLQLDEEDISLKISVDNLREIPKDILERVNCDEKLNYGSCILLPHASSILEKFKNKLQNKDKSLNQREIFILSRISELVWEDDISNQLLLLLLPILTKKCTANASEEMVLRYLHTVKNLLSNCYRQDIHFRYITILIGLVTYPSGRKVLINIIEEMAKKNSSLILAKDLIVELNAFDAKWVDQPDFERRHAAFKNIQTMFTNESVNIDLGLLLIQNCFYFIEHEKDLSLRENATHTLETICPGLLKKYEKSQKEIDLLLNETLFVLLRRGMKSNNSDVRYLTIKFLGHLSRECPTSHFILRDLNMLTNKQDLEVDFFVNLTHLQIHRHARALLKISNVVKNLNVKFNPRTCTLFLLPLVSHYLCSDKYVSKNSVIDAAIEAVGTLCRLLPWHQYSAVLKYYIERLRSKLDYQKQLVRLTVAILDAFHFDLSKGHIDLNDAVDPTLDNEEKDVPVNPELDEIISNLEDDKEDEIEESESCKDIIQSSDSIKYTKLCKSTASRIIKTIQMILLPQLHKSLAELTNHDTSHKINRRKTGAEREEQDLLRVPVSLALVKLLQRLPKDILDNNLPGIFMKLCTFLRSKMDSVRRVARETLQQIMLTLGPEYLSMLLANISPLLNRGFQVHVLVYTTHGVLSCLKDHYKVGDIDKVLLTVINLCTADLFGALSEEKEISKIQVKVAEANSRKSYDTFQILAQYISEKCLMDLVLPIKNILESTHSFKSVSKAQESLRFIAMGLVENQIISTETLLKFAYGTASESIPQLKTKKPNTLTGKQKMLLERETANCFIIPKMPVNRTSYRQDNVKTSGDTNSYLLIEFGLRLLHVLLKREKLKDIEFKPFIDPFVNIFHHCLTCKHLKLSTLTLQCLSWVMKFDLPSLQSNIKSIAKNIFAILHKYASAGLSKGDNFDLVVAAFKAMAVLVRDVKFHTVDVHQLKILLMYAEQDMHDHDRQATAFSLIKAIISRKLVVPEIHNLMKKVAELSVMSELDYIRTQARVVFHQFLMDYPLGDELDKHLAFYLSQMSYELQFGRESAIEMIYTLINSFPVKILAKQSGLLLINLAARLVNEEIPDCKKRIADAIFVMLNKLSKSDRDLLFETVILWFNDKNITHRRLAAQVCGVFVLVEKSTFDSRLKVLKPLILKQFGLMKKPGRFVMLNEKKDSKQTEEHERVKDHHLFQVYQLLLKICTECPDYLKDKQHINDLACHTQTLLSHPHDWVRLAASQFIGCVLSTTNVDQVSELLANNNSVEDGGFLLEDPPNSIKSLTLDLCDQLQPTIDKPELAEQVVKNLVCVARILQAVRINERRVGISLLWLAKRMRKIVNSEIVGNASKTVLRTAVFKWIAGVVTALEVESFQPVFNHLLAPLVREMITTEESNAVLRQLSKEVANLLKKKVGVEYYTAALMTLQQSLSVKRAERKRYRTQLAVTDPEEFAQKKIKRNQKKSELKKRKISELSGGKRTYKKRKVVTIT